jgi:PPOX class probable F420-dependent enzyme
MAKMTREEAIDFLSAGTHTGKLATASSVGAPHVAPIWFVLDDGELVFTTRATSVKGRHLRANPRAALTVDNEAFPFDFVAVRGPVTLSSDPDDLLRWATRIAERYVPEGRAEEYGRLNGTEDDLLCRLKPERISGMTDVSDISG